MLLRPAEPADALAVARVHVRSWQAAYRGLLPDSYLDSLRPEDRAAKYDFTHADTQRPHTLVAVEAGQIVGFATTMPSPDAGTSHLGELAALYVDPEHWHSGFGLALITAARAHLVAAGYTQAVLWILAGNARAARFYEKDGWIADNVKRTQLIWDIELDEARYRRDLVDRALSATAT